MGNLLKVLPVLFLMANCATSNRINLNIDFINPSSSDTTKVMLKYDGLPNTFEGFLVNVFGDIYELGYSEKPIGFMNLAVDTLSLNDPTKIKKTKFILYTNFINSLDKGKEYDKICEIYGFKNREEILDETKKFLGLNQKAF